MRKKFMDKGILLLLLMALSTFIPENTTYASKGNVQIRLEDSKGMDESIEPMKESVIWYYRTVNGSQQIGRAHV